MPEHIKQFDPNQEYYFEEGCHIVETSNSASDEAVSVVRARVEAGKQTRWHSLIDTYERYVITAGEGVVEVGDASPEKVQPGDVVLIPPNTRQRIRNPGSTDLKFLAICSPRFKKENYQDCEATNEVE